MTAPAVDVPRGTELALAIRLRDLQIELDLVDVADNVRTVDDPEADAQLLASVRELGVLEPVGVTLVPGGRYLLVYGHRRLRAARGAGLDAIPAVVVDGAPEERAFVQLIENLHRKDLNALDVAKAVQRTLDETPKLSKARLAERLGWAPSTLSNTLGLLRAPEEVQQLLAEGKLERAHVIALKGLSPAKQIQHARQAAEHGYSAHTLEEHARYDRERQKELDKRAADTAAAAAKGLALLEKEGTDTGTTLIVRAPWNLDREVIRATVAGAGYKLAGEGVYGNDLHPDCDCTVMVLDLTPEKRPTLSPGCVSDAHREAAWKARNAERDRADAAKREKRQALVGAVNASLVAVPIPRPVGLLVLRALEGYGGKTWREYTGMSDAELAGAIAERLFPQWDQGKPLPHATVLRDLGVDVADDGDPER